MRFRSRAAVVVAYAVAMAYVESAVVVYLQLAQSITPDHLFPIRGADVVGNLAAIEVGREAATMVMLLTIGILAGRKLADRLAWAAVAFGVWDILYYFWLWVFIGWPHSLGTWDVLFLIPVPWAGPVFAPLAVSMALIGFGLAVAARVEGGADVRIRRWVVAGALVGGTLVVLSFTLNAPQLMGGALPGWFPWPVFVAGMVIAAVAAVTSMRKSDGQGV